MSFDKFFFWLLSHVIYLKLTRAMVSRTLNYTKKNYFELGNLAKLMFWSIISFKKFLVIGKSEKIESIHFAESSGLSC